MPLTVGVELSSTGSGRVAVVDAVAVVAGRVGAAGQDRAVGRGRGGHERDRAPGRGDQADGDRRGRSVTPPRAWPGWMTGRSPGGRQIDQVAVVFATLESPPENLGVTHWSSRLLASTSGSPTSRWPRSGRSGAAAVAGARRSSSPPTRSWRPRSATSSVCISNPPDKAVVLCIDEKSQIQALDRTAPILPMRPGLPEKATHDYVRHGTTTLFAALEVATGKVTDGLPPAAPASRSSCASSSRSRRPTPAASCTWWWTTTPPTNTRDVKTWLANNPRITLHFTPTSGSWLNMVEIFFGMVVAGSSAMSRDA